MKESFSSALNLEIREHYTDSGEHKFEMKTQMPPPRNPDFLLNLLPEKRHRIGRYRVSVRPLILLTDETRKRVHILQTPSISDAIFHLQDWTGKYLHLKCLPDWDTSIEELNLRIFEVTTTGYLTITAEFPSDHE